MSKHVARYSILDSGFKIQDSQCRIQDSRFRIHSAGDRIEDSRFTGFKIHRIQDSQDSRFTGFTGLGIHRIQDSQDSVFRTLEALIPEAQDEL
jgi:hypothetical protein